MRAKMGRTKEPRVSQEENSLCPLRMGVPRVEHPGGPSCALPLVEHYGTTGVVHFAKKDARPTNDGDYYRKNEQVTVTREVTGFGTLDFGSVPNVDVFFLTPFGYAHLILTFPEKEHNHRTSHQFEPKRARKGTPIVPKEVTLPPDTKQVRH